MCHILSPIQQVYILYCGWEVHLFDRLFKWHKTLLGQKLLGEYFMDMPQGRIKDIFYNTPYLSGG